MPVYNIETTKNYLRSISYSTTICPHWVIESMDQLQDEEIRALTQNLNHQLASLAASLTGRLTPTEEETIANLFQMQMNLQSLLYEAKAEDHSSTLDPAVAKREADNIAYAQVMQYARDLVKAMRQKKEHQRRLELTSQQLIRAEKLATIGQVAATVAHELNNILTPLLMYAKLIYRESSNDSTSDIAEYATQISEIATRASNMLRQLVDASRHESAATIPVDLAKVIKNALPLLAPRLNNQNIHLEEKYPKSLPLVKGNPSQLEQVFINIALNAFDAMPNGGNFAITIQEEAGTDPTDEANFVSLRLTDTGEGISPDYISNIFEPFFTTKARGAGAGLGLFVSYLIVDQHNGAIEVESEPGVGTTFIVKLPTIPSKDDN